MLLDSFLFSNFNYCPLVQHFCSAALSQKIEKIQERTLRFLYTNSYSSYNNLLLKAERPITEVSHWWRLAIEVFKTLTLKWLGEEGSIFCFSKNVSS